MEEQETEGQSQVADSEVAAVQAGDMEGSYPAGAIEVTEPGAVQAESQKAEEKALTQEEWSKREAAILSAKDREIEGYRQREFEQATRQWQTQLQNAEVQAQARDKAEVDEGVITLNEAERRRRSRVAWQQQLLQIDVQRQAAEKVMAEAEQYGRVLAARDFGQTYGVKPEELLKDKSLTSPAQMEARAASLALEKAKAELKKMSQLPQHFDQGQLGGVRKLPQTPYEAARDIVEALEKKKG